jgi:hypothetical protein
MSKLYEVVFKLNNSFVLEVSNKIKRGCFLDLFLSTIVLAILSAIAIPWFTTIKTEPINSSMKYVLASGVKECFLRKADNQTTRFGDVPSFSYKRSEFKIVSLDPNSCFKAKALPTKGTDNTWFEVDSNYETMEVFKTCGDSSKPGCEEGNTW